MPFASSTILDPTRLTGISQSPQINKNGPFKITKEKEKKRPILSGGVDRSSKCWQVVGVK
jgi:hypothetical protein